MRREGHHFTKRIRDQLEALYNARVSVPCIAEQLGYSRQSIYKELKRGFFMYRNGDWTETKKYSADKAQLDAELQMTAKGAPLKIDNDKEFANFVEDMVLAGYSPGAILLYVKDHGLKFKTKVCRVTLYSYIDKGVFLKISNKNLLHKCKDKKPKEKKQPKKLPDIEHSIERRGPEINERLTFGHWEGDTVIGKSVKGWVLLTLTERVTRMEIIMKSPDKTAGSVVTALNRLERKLGSSAFRQIFKSITFDNGTEFSNVDGMEISPYTKKKRTSVFYCHSYCSSERGSNENQNGFIRRFIPKGIAISEFSDSYVRRVQDFINNYPRGIFDGESALKRFNRELERLNIQNFS